MIQPKFKINKKKKEARKEKVVTAFIYLVIALTLIIIFFTVKSTFLPQKSNNQVTGQAVAMQVPTISRMSLTSYDKELARKFMDKNNDGKCDSCGMPVEQCIDSGQMQCNMDSASTIGILQSQHIHVDWKIYINSIALSFEGKDYMGRMKNNLPVSSFIHVDSGDPLSEQTGDILHMHATGVPLWIFFESIEMKFSNECLELETGEKYCNDNKNSLKFYVNDKPNNEYENYVFKDLDKILITYGDKNQDITIQLNSITDFAKNH